MNVSVHIHVRIYVQNMYWSGRTQYCTYLYVLHVQDTYTMMHLVRICTYLYIRTYMIRTGRGVTPLLERVSIWSVFVRTCLVSINVQVRTNTDQILTPFE